MSGRIVIVGAGMAGIACAGRLVEAGHAPLILDKGRGIGGRMATRRVDLVGREIRFDHGAQYLTARNPAFAAALAEAPDAIARWEIGAVHPTLVGLPGMSGIVRAMAAGLDVRQGAEVTGLRRSGGGWAIEVGASSLVADHVVLTIPAPQAAALLGPDHPAARDLSAVEMAPCLALMAAFPPGSPRPFVTRSSDTHPLAWIAQDSAKPGRPDGAVAWIAQAGPDWSAEHLETDREALADRMLTLLCDVLAVDRTRVLYAAAHRWRYARVTTPLGQPFLRLAEGSLHLGGDWCLGARIEAAWQSGTSIADDILERRDAP